MRTHERLLPKALALGSSNSTGVEWDNDTVSKFFLIMFSILTDIAPGHVACFLWVNSFTSRVPFASVTGATRFLAIDAESHSQLHDDGSTRHELLRSTWLWLS
jgi:hypothetical protein